MLNTKQQNKRRKLLHEIDLLRNYDVVDIKDFMEHDENGARWTGSLYQVEKISMEELQSLCDKYDNTKVTTSYYRYAPEQKQNWLYIAYNYYLKG